MARPIADSLRHLQGGTFLEEASDQLAELVSAVDAGAVRDAIDHNARHLLLARRIADAASFFDTARAALAPSDKVEAEKHIEHLHDAAQVLAGDLNVTIYQPDGVPFETGKQYITKFFFENLSDPLELIHLREQSGTVNTFIVLLMGALRLPLPLCLSSPTELRQLALALKQLADDAEDSAMQGARAKPSEQEAA